MKGLPSLPTESARLAAYNQLQGAKALLPARRLALYSQWSRLDPRLAQIMVAHLARFWRQIAWGELRDEIVQQPWSRAILVLLRFVELSLDRKAVPVFRSLSTAFEKGLSPIPMQLFFISLQRPNRTVIDDEVDFRTEPYEQSGFIGSQSLLGRSAWPKDRTVLSRERRLHILRALFAQKFEVTVNEYMAACKNLVSRRQAQRDLLSFGKPKGFTKGRVYRS